LAKQQETAIKGEGERVAEAGVEPEGQIRMVVDFGVNTAGQANDEMGKAKQEAREWGQPSGNGQAQESHANGTIMTNGKHDGSNGDWREAQRLASMDGEGTKEIEDQERRESMNGRDTVMSSPRSVIRVDLREERGLNG